MPPSALTVPHTALEEKTDLLPLAETEAVDYYRRSRVTTTRFRGVWWFEFRPWFFTPIEHLAPLPTPQVGRPHWQALGYRAISSDPDVVGRTPAILVQDLADYGPERLTRDRRRELRQVLAAFEFRVLQAPDLLLAQGWRVATRAAAQSGHVLPRSEGAYRRQVRAMFGGPGPTFVAALRDGRLVGYMTSCAVGRMVSLEHLFIDPDVRREHVGVGLYWLSLRLWGKAPGVTTAHLGLTFPERPGLDPFKRTLGAEVVQLPSITGLVAPARWWLRLTRQHAHQRQTLRVDESGAQL
jgi:hypothetical protein